VRLHRLENPGDDSCGKSRYRHGEESCHDSNDDSRTDADDHHRDGIIGIWCPAAPGAQAMLIEANPKLFFRPPYVGPSGWVGVVLDTRPDWAMVGRLVHDAYLHVATARLRALAQGGAFKG
jgi:hypothetical protein